jgi:hypothetical protein
MTETQSDFAGMRRRPLPVRGGVALLAAVLVNAALVWVVGAVEIAPDFMALTYPPVVFLSALGALGATAVYALLGRFVDDVDRAFTRVATVVLVLSLVPDLGLLVGDPAATVPGVVVLMGMHVVVAAAAVLALVGEVRLR